MFDKELHQEFIFCSYLIKLLPAKKVEMIDIESKLKLEFYKLQKTFEGAITLEEKKALMMLKIVLVVKAKTKRLH
ncbi:hypothetical protein [Campylobacter sp.]|uniref:hypothetical protein n=1 Tax=Campylobacter sp. TaxID=205 RepID=UPI002A82060F|nr:hypothetical protein [Campylobacter sp.]MDY4155146.1 hypothetical protein [Campylobacter sp.]MDY4803857.1 hypothetical protein [Campylobacter sp.]